jgi:hypothetical protein
MNISTAPDYSRSEFISLINKKEEDKRLALKMGSIRKVTIKPRKHSQLNDGLSRISQYQKPKLQKKKTFDLEDLEKIGCPDYNAEYSTIVINNPNSINLNNSYLANDGQKSSRDRNKSLFKDYIIDDPKKSFIEGEDIIRKVSIYKNNSKKIIIDKNININSEENKYEKDSNATISPQELEKILVTQINYEDYDKIEFKFQSVTFNSVLTTISQICNCIIRYTFLNFPMCYAVMGMAYGFLITSLMGLFSIISTYMLLRAHDVNKEL